MPVPTPYVPSLAVDDVITALGGFLQPLVGQSTQIIRGQQNRVAPPPGPFVELTELRQIDLETPSGAFSAANAQVSFTGPGQIDIQVDFYGPAAGDWCRAVKTVFRTWYATSAFPDGIKPLFCTDSSQAPLTTGEEQYLDRWTITASLQYNPVVAIPQQSADTLAVNILEAVQ